MSIKGQPGAFLTKGMTMIKRIKQFFDDWSQLRLAKKTLKRGIHPDARVRALALYQFIRLKMPVLGKNRGLTQREWEQMAALMLGNAFKFCTNRQQMLACASRVEKIARFENNNNVIPDDAES
jgi:hypothetical protein